MRTLTLIAMMLLALSANAEKLTIERIYSEPELSGSAPVRLELSPDGTRVSYLKPADDDYLRLDLWEYNIAEQTHRLLVDSKQLVPDEGELSDVEKARRERQRVTNTGIVEYSWSKQGNALLFPLGGDLYYYNIANRSVKQLTYNEAFETDSRFSPQGNFVSFIRDQNLWIVEVATGKETAVTTEGAGPISYGTAEFIAQEEMGRNTGYWWSDDESAIAFTKVDVSPVGVEQRYEIYANQLKVFDQRYPKTGTANAIVQLAVADVKAIASKSGSRDYTWIDLGDNRDIYIPRVKWLPDNQTVAVQRESRDQKKLELLFASRKTGKTRVVLTETDKHWIRLHNALEFLKNQNAFVWASDRGGFRHLGLYNYQGELVKPLTRGNWEVTRLLGIDEKNQTLYFTANAVTPLEQHLYAINLDGKGLDGKGLDTESSKGENVISPQQLSSRTGWHNIEFSDDKRFYIDRFSNTTTPPQVSLHRADGKLLTYLAENKLDISHPYFPYLEQHVQPEFGNIRAADGQRLYYQLFRPDDFDSAKRYPVIIEVYGGPGIQRVRNTWTNPWHQYLAQHGYVVFLLDNRGGANRGRAFETPIYHQLGEVEVEDQQAGVKYLRSLTFVDPQRIGIFGWSYGGYMALMTVLKAPQDFAAAVSVAPVTDWALYDTHYTERYLGTPQDNPDGYAASSVFSYVDHLQNPLLIVHGMADDNVLFTNSTKLFSELQSKDLPFEMMTYPGAKHGIRGKMQRRHVYKAITAFFDRTIKNNK